MTENLVKRFFRYVKIDTQSKEGVEDRFPSTEKQKDLLKILVDEMKTMDLKNVSMDENGYVTATFPSNLSKEDTSKVPTIGLLAHVDTSPDVSGKNVNPVIHKNYSGGDIIFPGDTSIVLKPEENPCLQDHIGDDIITSDGTTLLGADNKAGIAEILTAIEHLQKNPQIKHGDVRRMLLSMMSMTVILTTPILSLSAALLLALVLAERFIVRSAAVRNLYPVNLSIILPSPVFRELAALSMPRDVFIILRRHLAVRSISMLRILL